MTLRRLAACIGWLLTVAIVAASLVPIESRPGSGLNVGIERIGAFACVGAAFVIAYPQRRVLVLVGLLAMAGALEAAQLFLVSRHARMLDFLVKAVGTGIGVLGGILADRIVLTKLTRQ